MLTKKIRSLPGCRFVTETHWLFTCTCAMWTEIMSLFLRNRWSFSTVQKQRTLSPRGLRRQTMLGTWVSESLCGQKPGTLGCIGPFHKWKIKYCVKPIICSSLLVSIDSITLTVPLITIFYFIKLKILNKKLNM